MLQRFTQWFNGCNRRSGTLWERAFKSVVVEDGEAARTMAAYIDLNPIRAGIVQDLADYRWNSYGEAVGGGRWAVGVGGGRWAAGGRAMASGRVRDWCAPGWHIRDGGRMPGIGRGRRRFTRRIGACCLPKARSGRSGSRKAREMRRRMQRQSDDRNQYRRTRSFYLIDSPLSREIAETMKWAHCSHSQVRPGQDSAYVGLSTASGALGLPRQEKIADMVTAFKRDFALNEVVIERPDERHSGLWNPAQSARPTVTGTAKNADLVILTAPAGS